MDAVGVRAVSGRHDLHSMHLDVMAPFDQYVEHLAIERGQPSDDNVVGVDECE